METTVNEISVNGVDYVRKDSVAASAVPAGPRCIVVVDRGWVFCGDIVEDAPTGRVQLANALHVLRWESIGFGGLVAEEDRGKIKTKPVAGVVDVPAGAELFRVPVHERWGR